MGPGHWEKRHHGGESHPLAVNDVKRLSQQCQPLGENKAIQNYHS
jgi:hypothetical protein